MARAFPAFLFIWVGLSLTHCDTSNNTSSTTVDPGIVVGVQSLVSSKGCGMAARQVYKYAAVVVNGGTGIAAALYDCYADAQFVNLPAAPDGGLTFEVLIFAYDAPTFDPMMNATAIAQAVMQSTANPQALTAITPKPTYTTTCQATQQAANEQVQVLATCGALVKP